MSESQRLEEWELQLIANAILTCRCASPDGCAICQGWADVLQADADGGIVRDE